MLFRHQLPSIHPPSLVLVRVNAVLGHVVADCGASTVFASVNNIACEMMRRMIRALNFIRDFLVYTKGKYCIVV
jgi:hypothetical protein